MRLAADSTRHFDCSIDNMGGGFDLQRVVHPGLNRSDRDRTKRNAIGPVFCLIFVSYNRATMNLSLIHI